jgi:hypothetical protein
LGGGREDAQLPARESAYVPHEHLDLLRRIADEGHAEVRAFVEAVLTLLDDPQPANVERYLVASHALEDSRSSRRPGTSRGRNGRPLANVD